METNETYKELDRLDVWFREFDRQPYEAKQTDAARAAYGENTNKYLALKAALEAEFGKGAWWN